MCDMIQARFELDEEYQKIAVLRHMGGLWRASKSRLVTKLRCEANTNQERMNLRPKNVTPTEWRKFVKLKTSSAFAAVSESYKERRRLQIPHTCSRKGMVRLAEDMVRSINFTMIRMHYSYCLNNVLFLSRNKRVVIHHK